MNGIGASGGIGIGVVFIKKELPVITESFTNNIESELVRLEQAIKEVSADIDQLYLEKKETLGEKDAQIFKAHQLIVQDPELDAKIKSGIKDNSYSAEYSTKVAIDIFISMFENMDNDYFKERALDMKDVGKRIKAKLLGISLGKLSSINQPTIIVAKDLTPSDTAQLNPKFVQGIITEDGGRTSHSAIIARTLGIPAVMGVDNLIDSIKNNDTIIVDGDKGVILINPSKDELSEYKKKQINHLKEQEALKEYIGQETQTKDGKTIELSANIASLSDLNSVLSNDADGVGLFRSEFIYMDRDSFPSEEEQYNIYKKALINIGNKPMIIRTMDIGGDKEVSYLDFGDEMNPFLGYRAIRYCLDHKDIFKTQLRALLRASIYGQLKIMFPMVSTIREVRAIKKLLDESKLELKNENIKFSEDIEIGIMIEVPSAAMMADHLAKEVDFFSIGTNDLIQYMTATDRMNSKLKKLYTPYHPGVLRLINSVIKSAHKEGIWVGMCGSVAGNQKLIPVLLGMGLDEFSMSPSLVLQSRKLINKSSITDLQLLVTRVLNASDATEVETLLE